MAEFQLYSTVQDGDAASRFRVRNNSGGLLSIDMDNVNTVVNRIVQSPTDCAFAPRSRRSSLVALPE